MNIFVCWSGNRSQGLAEAVCHWFPRFLPGLKLFLSSKDIPKGALWFDHVSGQLSAADAGIICLTPENLRSEWIHFEAGALAGAVGKSERGGIYTYLLKAEPDELKGPLAEYQSTRCNREETRTLVGSIVAAMKRDEPTGETWEKCFDEHWQGFEEQVRRIKPLSVEDLVPGLAQMFRRKTFEEPLDECSDQTWMLRYGGAYETLGELRRHQQAVQTDNSYLFELYNELTSQLNGYLMDMNSRLIEARRFPVGDDGKLLIPDSVRKPCENRRRHVKQLVTQLLTPDGGPVLEESRRFLTMKTIEEKKDILIHPHEREIERAKDPGELKVTGEALERCATSWWEFDRIYYYLVQESSDSPDTARLVKCVGQEFEKVKIRDGETSLAPLHYAVRALKEALAGSSGRGEPVPLAPRVRSLLRRIGGYLADGQRAERMDKGNEIKDNVAEILSSLDAAAGDVPPEPPPQR